MKTTRDKRVMSVRITDKKAIELVNDRAAREHRSASNAGAVTIVEALSQRTNKQSSNDPDFLSRRVCKDNVAEAGESSEKNQ